MDELTLEVGKTYVFKDEEAKKAWLERDETNLGRFCTQYRDGFKLTVVGRYGGWVDGEYVISHEEIKYFKLKEENGMKEFTKDMLVAGKHICETRNGLKYMVMLDSDDKLFMSDPSSNCGWNDLEHWYSYNLKANLIGSEWDITKVYTTEESNFYNWDGLTLVWQRQEITEQQKKILELQETINKAQEQIKQLKGE